MFEITFLYHIFIFRITWVLKSYAFFRWSAYSIGVRIYFYYWNIGLQHVSFGISGTEFIIERIIILYAAILDLTIGARMLAWLSVRTIHNFQLMRFESRGLLIIDSNKIWLCSLLMLLNPRPMAFLLFDIQTFGQSASMPRILLRARHYLPSSKFAVFNVCVVFLVSGRGCDSCRVFWWRRSIWLRLSWISSVEVYDACLVLFFRGTIMRLINAV